MFFNAYLLYLQVSVNVDLVIPSNQPAVHVGRGVHVTHRIVALTY